MDNLSEIGFYLKMMLADERRRSGTPLEDWGKRIQRRYTRPYDQPRDDYAVAQLFKHALEHQGEEEGTDSLHRGIKALVPRFHDVGDEPEVLGGYSIEGPHDLSLAELPSTLPYAQTYSRLALSMLYHGESSIARP